MKYKWKYYVIRLAFVLGVLFSSQWCRAQYDVEADSVIMDTSGSIKINIDDTDKEDEAAVDTDEVAEDISHYVPDTPAMRQVPDTVVSRLQQDKDFAYANDPSYWVRKKEKPRGRGFWELLAEWLMSPTVRTIIYILLGGILLFALYRVILVNKLYVFYSSKRKRPAAQETHLSEIEDDRLDEKVAAAIAAGENRQAVRYMYLKALRELNEKGWIRFHPEATNYEYVNQVASYPAGEEFAFLTRVYEYVWYGEFPLGEDRLQRVQQHFNNLYNQIKT